MKATRRQQTAGRIVGHSRAADNSSEFHGYFSSQFLQRYADLFQALAQPVQHVALLNAFADVDDCDQLGLESCYRSGVVSCLRFPQPVTSYPPPPQCPYTQLKQFYWLDFASVLPPLLLAVQPHHTVLDMCAAPGGKSLILAQQLLRASAPGQQEVEVNTGLALSVDLLQQLSFKVDQQQQEQHDSQQPEQLQQQQQQQQEQQNSQQPAQQQQQQQILHTSDSQGVSASDQDDAVSDSSHGTAEEPQEVVSSSAVAVVSRGRLVCNELDPVRRQRLSGVINSYLPGGLRRHVRVTSHDAVKYWSTFESEMYDRVLLDAPCTSERHVVAAACEAGGVVSASSWSLQHCEQLAALQLKLLLAGLRALKPGGRLVYSTCSMADMENDHVVLKALQQTAKSIMSKTHAGSCTVRAVPIDEWGLDQQLEDLVGADRTQYGLLVLPDKQGYGPIYLSMLEKCSA